MASEQPENNIPKLCNEFSCMNLNPQPNVNVVCNNDLCERRTVNSWCLGHNNYVNYYDGCIRLQHYSFDYRAGHMHES